METDGASAQARSSSLDAEKGPLQERAAPHTQPA